MSEEMVKIRGEVESIHVTKDEGRWCVFLFHQDTGDRVNVVGSFPDLRESSAMEITGKWARHPKYGRQMKAVSYVLVVPTSKDGIRAYLDWALPQIGPQRARRMVEEFGEETLSVLENTPEKLLIIPGITEARLQDICKSWKEGAPRREAYIYLARFGLTQAMTEGVIEYFGAKTVEIVKKDPYVLTEVSGLGFNKVDEIALRMGIGENSPERRRAALLYLFRKAST
ncbi:MAG: ATP-dependent RecD-like DNA helicase, partial [Dehalococcoidia bacterium]|nr:ATP-dependent RecD-like DNA helicase [Dehalococcoidia bacterium]